MSPTLFDILPLPPLQFLSDSDRTIMVQKSEKITITVEIYRMFFGAKICWYYLGRTIQNFTGWQSDTLCQLPSDNFWIAIWNYYEYFLVLNWTTFWKKSDFFWDFSDTLQYYHGGHLRKSRNISKIFHVYFLVCIVFWYYIGSQSGKSWKFFEIVEDTWKISDFLPDFSECDLIWYRKVSMKKQQYHWVYQYFFTSPSQQGIFVV